jgi:micrococcal nuclease
MKRIKKHQLNLLIAALFLVISGLFTKTIPNNSQNITSENITPTPTPNPSPSLSQAEFYKVIKIVDGDTFDVSVSGRSERVRLIGVDTPELVDPRKPVQCFGREASNKTKEILTGKKVKLESDPTQGDKDKYGRLLRYVFLEDGTNFNKLLISEGFAHEYTYNLPYKYRDEFLAAEKFARENKLGLWAGNACSATPTPRKFHPPPSKPSLFPTRPMGKI